jgi:tetratricopeptide (TPR) repeat protein
MTREGDERTEQLRNEAEGLLRRARPRAELVPVLERLAASAPDGSDDSTFAHRHLAELSIEENPWRAALHLRRVVLARGEDDVVHALLGLCHALLGNFRAAVSYYRRALKIAPRNPWYHHNVGHLLDVALATPAQALLHLRSAHRLEPLEDEITASLAHCLATAGELAEARSLADDAVRAAPRNREHRALLAWIDRGAPVGEGPHSKPPPSANGRIPSVPPPRSRRSAARSSIRAGADLPPREDGDSVEGLLDHALAAADAAGAARAAEPSWQAVDALIDRGMREGGFTARQLDLAHALWRDFRDALHPRVHKPAVCAAAVEYALSLAQGMGGVTQASVARRYGVTAASLATRYGQIRDALALRPRDPRYGH